MPLIPVPASLGIGYLKLRFPKRNFPKRKLPKLRSLSFCSLNSRRLNLDLKPLKNLNPPALAAALVASCAGLSAVAGAQPTVAVAERGDLALVPYYTVRGQWVTGIHIVNTSDSTQVVKVRFRRATDGLNVLDFNLVMSPADVYAGFLSDDDTGTMAWTSPDTTCTAPATRGKRLIMPPIYRVGAESGYVEIIAMGRAQDEQQPLALAARHDPETSTPRNCAAVRSNFFADGASAADPGVQNNRTTYQRAYPGATNAILKQGGRNTYSPSGDVLKVSYFIRDNATGVEFGDNAVHIANFLGAASITNQQYGIASGDLNGFDFPDLDGAGLPRAGVASDPNPTIVRNRFNRLRRADVLGAKRIINEWSANPANGVEMDWVLTLPGQYTMLRLPQYLKSLGTDRAWVSTVDSAGNPLANPRCPRTAIAASAAAAAVPACDFRDLPVKLTYAAYNREAFKDQAPAGTLVVSPQPPTARAETHLPKVANVITFGGRSVLGQTDANVNPNLGQPFGWVEAQLESRQNPKVCQWDPSQDSISPSAATVNLTLDCATSATGHAPVIGFAAWSRKVAANPDASYARIVEHSYERASLIPQAPGTVFRDPLKDGGEGPQMVVLPTGSFQMGSPSTEADRGSNEGPVRTVTLSQRIAMGRYEVSFADYDRFVAAESGARRPGDSGWGRGSRPVINVNWNEAQAYATWLSTQTGKTYRLPTEAEWEYAARAGTTTAYSFGDSISCSQASYSRSLGALCNTGRDANLARTAAVGRFAANAFGLYDMHGNVWEWVEDCYVDTYSGAPSDGSARTTDCGTTRFAVVRSGSWFFIPRSLRSAYRFRFTPSTRANSLGFRLVQDLNP